MHLTLSTAPKNRPSARRANPVDQQSQLEPGEFLEQRRLLQDAIASEQRHLLRLKQMYPPDGGGRGFEALSNIHRLGKALEDLQRPPDEELDRLYVRKIKDYLANGYSPKEIAGKLGLSNVRDLIPKVDSVVHYEDWIARLADAVVHREVLVWSSGRRFSGRRFEVRYYSMTPTGRHSRLVKSKVFATKSRAIAFALKTKRRNE